MIKVNLSKISIRGMDLFVTAEMNILLCDLIGHHEKKLFKAISMMKKLRPLEYERLKKMIEVIDK